MTHCAIAQMFVVSNQANDTVCNWIHKLFTHVVQLSANMDDADKKKRRDLVARYMTGDRKGDADAVVKRWNKAQTESVKALECIAANNESLSDLGCEWTKYDPPSKIEDLPDHAFFAGIPAACVASYAEHQPDALLLRIKDLFYNNDIDLIEERMREAGCRDQEKETLAEFIMQEFLDFQRSMYEASWDIASSHVKHYTAEMIHVGYTRKIAVAKEREESDQRRLLGGGVSKHRRKKTSPIMALRMKQNRNKSATTQSFDYDSDEMK
jgi:hypothetical protein